MKNPVSDKVGIKYRGKRESVMSAILMGGRYSTDRVMLTPTEVPLKMFGVDLGVQMLEPYRCIMYKRTKSSSEIDGTDNDVGFRVVRNQ